MTLRQFCLICTLACVATANSAEAFSLFQNKEESPAPVVEQKIIRQVMTVQQAYDSIPHLRVAFTATKASAMPKEHAHYLEQLFRLTDIATVERVQTQIFLMGKQGGGDNNNYMPIILHLGKLRVPEELEEVHNLITEAIVLQSRFFERWRKDGSLTVSRGQAEISESSTRLIAAYNLLMQAYPNENAEIKNAFFQHLCALDFV